MSAKKKTPKAQKTAALRKIDPITVTTDGSLLIDMNQLEMPTKTYDADVAWPSVRYGTVSLFFGKCDLNKENRLRTRLEVRYSPDVFAAHFWKNSRKFHKDLSALRETFHGWDKTDAIEPEKWEARDDHSEWANFDYIARTGGQGVVDFYRLSPTAIVRFTRNQGTRDLAVEPVVRIFMTTLEILRLLDSCESIANQFGPAAETIGESK